MLRGITAAPLLSDLKLAKDRGALPKDIEVTIIHASQSKVSTPEMNQHLEDYLVKQLGMTAVRRIELSGDSHAMIDSLPRYIAIMRLAMQYKRWN